MKLSGAKLIHMARLKIMFQSRIT